MESLKNILLQVTDSIGIITIDNPPGNFLIKPEFIPLNTLKDWIEINQLKGIIICGTGKHFSGGANLGNLFSMADAPGEMMQEMNQGKVLLDYIESLTIPVIAAIHGTCFGGGLEIALACHIRICSENALFAFPEINHGLMPGLGGLGRTKERSSFHDTITFILGGDMISAKEALSIKITDQIVPSADLLNHSFNLLKKMTDDRDLKVIHFVMKAIHNTRTLSKEEAMKEETRMFCELAKDEVERQRREKHENQ